MKEVFSGRYLDGRPLYYLRGNNGMYIPDLQKGMPASAVDGFLARYWDEIGHSVVKEKNGNGYVYQDCGDYLLLIAAMTVGG